MVQNVAVIGIKYFCIDLIGGIIGFPLWWYSRGLKDAVHFCFGSIRNQWLNLALGIWLKNLFIPMYGETSIAGRIISVFMRSVILVGRGIIFIVWTIIMVALFALYLVILPFVVIALVYNLAGMNIVEL